MRNLRAAHVRAFQDACRTYCLYLSIVEAKRVLEIARDLNDALDIARSIEHQALNAVEANRLLARVRHIEDALVKLTGDTAMAYETDCPDADVIAKLAEVTEL